MKFLFSILLVVLVGVARANLTADEQRQRIDEENAVRFVQEQESPHLIPKSYDSRSKAFISKEGKSPLHPETILIRLGNASKKPIYFSGYPIAQPIYHIQKNSNSVWKDIPRDGWLCGTGLGIRSLNPGMSVVFEVKPKYAFPEYRIGVDLFTAPASNQKSTLWSD